MFIITCNKCKESFKAEDNGGMPGGKEKETIHCPTCNADCGEHMANGIWICAPLSAEEKKIYKK